jgi:16S rRNA U1498 N3-methylase RsmE
MAPRLLKKTIIIRKKIEIGVNSIFLAQASTSGRELRTQNEVEI